MKKLILSLCALIALPLTGLCGEKKVFTVASLNVDGLPPNVTAAGQNVKLNPEGPQETGTLQISKLVSQKGWDFFSVSEAFNYNTQLMSSLQGVYNTGTFRQSIPSSVGVGDALSMLAGNKWFDTDGLNLLWRSGIEVSGENWVLWNKRNGTTSDGADQLIAKGYRYYKVTVGNGMDIDVYIHHMDAETSDADNAAREVQMNQLVDAILASNNKRPILIMGDTNCRYTRDKIVEIMFNRIDADPRFTMHDPWIDFPRKGQFPPCPSGSLMVPRPYDGTEESHQGFQTGEVVDKIWWIENTESPCKLTALNYLQDTDFTWPDGSEISDHYPIVIDFEIERVRDDISGGQFYLHNIGTDKWMAAGHNWGTRGIVNNTGISITLAEGSETGTFNLSPSNMYTNDKKTPYVGDNLYMDNGTPLNFEINLVSGTNYYTITRKDNGKALAATASDDLEFATADASNANQQWELIAASTRLENLKAQASETNPMDATFLIPGYSMPRNDTGMDKWMNSFTSKGSQVNSEIVSMDDAKCNSVARIYNNDNSTGKNTTWSISNTISGLPNGKYIVGCQIFSDNNDAKLSFNGKDVAVTRINQGGHYSTDKKTSWGIASYTANNTAGTNFNNGDYKVSTEITITDNQLTTIISKPSGNSSAGQIFFDNFFLTYLGPTAEDMAAIDRVKAAIDDAQAKANAKGYSEYSNRAVVNAWENRLIQGNGDKEVHNTYIALAKASAKQRTLPAEMPYAILNNSFEMGNLTEWKNNATNATVAEDSKATDGSYIFKADKGSISYDFEVTMQNGIYELSADVTPGTVLTAAGEKSAPATGAAGELTKASVKFMITAGTTTIGAENSGAFMADNFVVKRLTDHKAAQAIHLIRIAMADATAKINAMGAPYNDGWAEKMAPYQAMIDNLEVSGSGEEEFTQIYDLLRDQVYLAGNNMTNAIINPSFELDNGSTLGWTLMSTAGDTGAKDNSNTTYKMSSADGNYIFNTWDEGRGTIISQTIKNLPAGHYQLRATFANDANKYVFLEVQGQEGVASQKKMFQCTPALETGVVQTLDFEVAADTPQVTILAGGCNSDGTWDGFGGDWYKVDNFQLVRTGDPDKCFFYTRLNNAIKETTRVANTLPKKYREQWDAKDYQDLYDRHINSNHEGEDEIGSGITEINELFQRLRDLIFSQTETGADMSGAITNNSFELGDLTGWTTAMIPSADAKVIYGNRDDEKDENEKVIPGHNYGTYKTAGTDADYLYNAWLGDTANPIWQVIPGVPAGVYKLTVSIASDPDNMFFLGANDKHSEKFTVTKNKGEFEDFTFEFEVKADQKDVKIGVYPTLNDDDFDMSDAPTIMGPWYKLDNFRLKLESRLLEVNWTMETPTHGTIILPFDVEADKLAAENLEVYTITKSEWSETPADEEINTYRILSYDKQPKLLANTPYVIKNIATQGAKAKRRRGAARVTESGNTYTFEGYTQHTQDSYSPEGNLLTGTLVEHDAARYEHHFQLVGDNVGFVFHGDADENATQHDNIEPYHAYIHHPLIETGEYISGFYFYEPELPIEWEMEGTHYGTIILPFDLTGDALTEFRAHGLKIYSLTSVGEVTSGETGEYQIVTREEVTGDLAANTPYMVMTSEAAAALDSSSETAEAMLKAPRRRATRAGEGESEESEETATPTSIKHTFSGAATNEEAAYTHGLLTGVFTTTAVSPRTSETAAGDRLLFETDNKLGGFDELKEGEATAVTPYHAYVAKENPKAEGSTIFLAEPSDFKTNVDELLAGKYGNVDVYTVSGVMVRSDVTPAEALRDLDRGIYIFRAGDKSVKIFK